MLQQNVDDGAFLAVSRLSLAEVRLLIVKLIVSHVPIFLVRSYRPEDREEARFLLLIGVQRCGPPCPLSIQLARELMIMDAGKWQGCGLIRVGSLALTPTDRLDGLMPHQSLPQGLRQSCHPVKMGGALSSEQLGSMSSFRQVTPGWSIPVNRVPSFP